jgi:hypothetical protein
MLLPEPGHSLLSWAGFRSELSSLTIQGQAICAAATDTTVLPVEIAFLANHGVDSDVLRRAAAIASRTGSSADETLLRLDFIDEKHYYSALAAEIGLPFLADEVPVGAEARFPYSLVLGLAPLVASPTGARFVLAPAGRRVAWLLTRRRPFADGFAVTTRSALRKAMFRAHSGAIAAAAANELADAQPHRSYRARSTAPQKGFAAGAVLTFLAGALAAPDFTLSTVVVLSGLFFLSMVAVRLAALREHVSPRPVRTIPRQRDDALPIYTIIVPLRRERRVLARLVGALEALDYPGLMQQMHQGACV